MNRRSLPLAFVSLGLILAAPAAMAQVKLLVPGGDIPAKFTPPTPARDYDVREVMIPMRDGVKLYTIIVIPKGAMNAPILLTRTPYNAHDRKRSDSASMVNRMPEGDEVFVRDGYIRVFQDIRGKYRSEGAYVITRPPIGPLNRTKVDHTTDAYDTIDWLVKKANLPQIERQGRDARLVLRRPDRRHGAAQPASGAQGRRARKPDGRRLDGRRLVPPRRLPPRQYRLDRQPDRLQGRRQVAHRPAAGTITTISAAPDRPGTGRRSRATTNCRRGRN